MSLITHYPDVTTTTTTTTTVVAPSSNSSWLCDINNSDVWLLEYPVCTTRYNSIVVFVIVCAVLSFITLWTIFGNVLVLLALYKYTTLRTMSNCLIGNLAISDLLLATTVLPISICNDVLGYWVFGELACTMWLLADVLYCTASVWGLCTVAFDRYMATVYPVWYHDQRSVEKAIVCIVFVWIFSFVISFAPVIGWQHMIPNFFTFNARINSYECVLFMTSSYVIYSAVGSFIIPTCLMIFMYVRIFTVLHRKSKKIKQKLKRDRHIEKKNQSNGCPAILEPLGDKNECVVRDFTTTTLISIAAMECAANSNETDECEDLMETDHLLTIPAVTVNEDSPTNSLPQHTGHIHCTLIETNDNNLHPNSSLISSNGNLNTLAPKNDLCTDTSLNNICNISGSTEFPLPKRRSQSVFVEGSSQKDKSPSITFLNVNDLERRNSHEGTVYPNSSEAENSHAPGNSLFMNAITHRSKSANILNSSDEDATFHSPRLPRRSLPCDLAKFGRNKRMTLSMKRRFELREQRATKRMLLIMASFIVCWMPFVGMYISRSLCSSCSMNMHFVSAIIWLGYANSSLNPVLYSLFNDDFKSAFKKLLGFKTNGRRRVR